MGRRAESNGAQCGSRSTQRRKFWYTSRMVKKHAGGRPRDPNAGEPQSTRLRPGTKRRLEALARRRRITPALAVRYAVEVLVGERERGDFAPAQADA